MEDELSLEAIRNFLQEKRESIGEKFGVKKNGIFGSFVRGNEKATSDIIF